MSCGTVIRNTPVAVDYWYIHKCPKSVSLFFLTHMHSDHTVGLTPSWSQTIYCTPDTKKLLIHQYKFPDDQIHGLEVGESHVITVSKSETVTVTPIDASHCPGAAMFLFEGKFGRILHTGDFRFSASMLNDETFLSISEREIDILYVDNTYLLPKCRFPPREETIPIIVRIIQESSDARVMIGLHKLGKEDLVIMLARVFKERIGVSEERMRTLEVLEKPNVFCVSTSCRICVVNRHEISSGNMERWNSERRTIAIVPSALGSALGHSRLPVRDDVFSVPYSDHSSYDELLRFVEMLQPRRVLPVLVSDDTLSVTSSLSSRCDMSVFKLPNYTPSPAKIQKQRLLSVDCADDEVDSQSVISSRPAPAVKRKRSKFHFKSNAWPKGIVYSSDRRSPSKKTSNWPPGVESKTSITGFPPLPVYQDPQSDVAESNLIPAVVKIEKISDSENVAVSGSENVERARRTVRKTRAAKTVSYADVSSSQETSNEQNVVNSCVSRVDNIDSTGSFVTEGKSKRQLRSGKTVVAVQSDSTQAKSTNVVNSMEICEPRGVVENVIDSGVMPESDVNNVSKAIADNRVVEPSTIISDYQIQNNRPCEADVAGNKNASRPTSRLKPRIVKSETDSATAGCAIDDACGDDINGQTDLLLEILEQLLCEEAERIIVERKTETAKTTVRRKVKKPLRFKF